MDTIYRQDAIDALDRFTVEDKWDTLKDALMALPTAEQKLYGYDIEHLAFIAALLQKENISPEELKDMLTDIGRMTRFVVDDITDTIQRTWKVSVNDKLMEVDK